MKQFLTAAVLLLATTSFGQVPDTVYVSGPDVDGNFQVFREILYDNGSGATQKTEPMDSLAVINYVANQIHDNELKYVAGARILNKKAELDAIYADINGILTSFTGAGYLPNAWVRYQERYTGVWALYMNQSSIYAYAGLDRSLTQIDSIKTTACVDDAPVSPGVNYVMVEDDCGANQTSTWILPTASGYTGTIQAVTQNSILWQNFLPTSLLPAGERLVRIHDASPYFFGLNSVVLFEKL